MKKHARRGWRVLTQVHTAGECAILIERDILGRWRGDLDLPPFLAAGDMPQGGWTETVDAEAIDIPATIRRMQELAASEEFLSAA